MSINEDMAKVKAFKDLAKKKADKGKKRKKNSGEFNTEKPNVVKITKESKKYGNVLLGFSIDNKRWRFGHDISQIHPITVIDIEDGEFHQLPTLRIYDYIHETNPKWIFAKYGIFNTRAYQIDIDNLIAYCSKETVNA